MKSTSFPKKIDLVYTIIDEIDIINNNNKIDSILKKKKIYIYIYDLIKIIPLFFFFFFLKFFYLEDRK